MGKENNSMELGGGLKQTSKSDLKSNEVFLHPVNSYFMNVQRLI